MASGRFNVDGFATEKQILEEPSGDRQLWGGGDMLLDPLLGRWTPLAF